MAIKPFSPLIHWRPRFVHCPHTGEASSHLTCRFLHVKHPALDLCFPILRVERTADFEPNFPLSKIFRTRVQGRRLSPKETSFAGRNGEFRDDRETAEFALWLFPTAPSLEPRLGRISPMERRGPAKLRNEAGIWLAGKWSPAPCGERARLEVRRKTLFIGRGHLILPLGELTSSAHLPI